MITGDARRAQLAPPEEESWVGRFGDSAASADELLVLVLAGTERGTAGLILDHVHEAEPLPRVGGHRVVYDGTGRPPLRAPHRRAAPRPPDIADRTAVIIGGWRSDPPGETATRR